MQRWTHQASGTWEERRTISRHWIASCGKACPPPFLHRRGLNILYAQHTASWEGLIVGDSCGYSQDCDDIRLL